MTDRQICLWINNILQGNKNICKNTRNFPIKHPRHRSCELCLQVDSPFCTRECVSKRQSHKGQRKRRACNNHWRIFISAFPRWSNYHWLKNDSPWRQSILIDDSSGWPTKNFANKFISTRYASRNQKESFLWQVKRFLTDVRKRIIILILNTIIV